LILPRPAIFTLLDDPRGKDRVEGSIEWKRCTTAEGNREKGNRKSLSSAKSVTVEQVIEHLAHISFVST